MSFPAEFYLEDDPSPEILGRSQKSQPNEPWYKSLPQAELKLPGRLAARAVTGSAQLHPAALALDLFNFASKHGLGGVLGELLKDKIPTSQDIIKPIEHLAGLSENPEGIERTFKNIGEYLQLAKGGGLKKTLAKGIGLAAGEEGVGELLGEEARNAYKIVAPLGIKSAEPLATGKHNTGESTLKVAVEKDPELKKLYDYGKSIGMEDSQLAPILQPDWKTKLFGKFSKKTSAVKNQIDQTKARIGENYNALKQKGQQQGVLNPTQQYDLYSDLVDVYGDMSKTNVFSDDTKKVLSTIEEAIGNVSNNPQTIEELINTYQNLNGIPNWKAAQDGTRRLRQVNEIFQKAISNKSKSIGEEFALTNKMYQRQAKFRGDLGVRRNVEDILTIGETVGLVSGLAYGIVTGDFGKAGSILGISGARRLGTQLLTNPKLQGIHRNMMKALTSGDQTALANAFKSLEPYIESQFPGKLESYDAPEFLLED